MHTKPFGVTINDPTVHVQGDLDMAGAETLLEAIRALAHASSDHAIALDLTELTFVDSTGISVFVRAHQELERGGKQLVIESVPDRVERTLELAGVTAYLNVRSALV